MRKGILANEDFPLSGNLRYNKLGAEQILDDESKLGKELGEDRLGYQEAMTNVDSLHEGIGDAEALIPVIEQVNVCVGQANAEGGMSVAGTDALNQAMEHLYRSIGVSKKRIIAYESFGTNSVSLEDAKTFISNVITKIKEAFIKMCAFIVNAIKHLFGIGKTNCEKAEALQTKVNEILKMPDVSKVIKDVEAATEADNVIETGSFVGDSEKIVPKLGYNEKEVPKTEKDDDSQNEGGSLLGYNEKKVPKLGYSEKKVPKTEKDFGPQYVIDSNLGHYFRNKPKSLRDNDKVRSIVDGQQRAAIEEALIYKSFSNLISNIDRSKHVESVYALFATSLKELAKCRISAQSGNIKTYADSWEAGSENTYIGKIIFPFDSSIVVELKSPNSARATSEAFETEAGKSNALRLCTIEEAKAIIKVVKESTDAGEKELVDIRKTLEHIRDTFNEAFDESKIDVKLPEGHMGDPEEIRKTKLKYQSDLFTTKRMCLTFALQLYTQAFKYKNTMNSHLLEWANKSLTIWAGLLS